MKARILSGLALVVMLGLSGLTVVTLLDVRDETRRREISAAHDRLATGADEIDRIITVYDQSLRAAAGLRADTSLSGAGPALPRFEMFNQPVPPALFGPMRVIDADGRIVRDSSTMHPAPPSTAERDALERHRHDSSNSVLFSGQPHFADDNGGDLAMSHRLNDAEGRFAGMVSGTLRLSYVTALLQRSSLGPCDSVGLIGIDGTLLARSPDTPGVGDVLDGAARLYSFVRVGRWPLVIDLGIARDRLYAPWRHRALIDGASLLLMLAAGLFLILALHRELRRRISAEWEYRLLADHASDVILRLDRGFRTLYASPSCRQYGYEPADLLGDGPPDLVHGDDIGAMRAALERARTEGRDVEVSYWLRCKDGRRVWVEGRYNHVARGGDFIAIIRNISRRKEMEAALELANADLERLAATDALTGLCNRRGFDERLLLEWRRAARGNTALSVMLIDVDHFKLFNDHYGHLEGDAVLRAVATTIRGRIRYPSDLAARYGGEEFVVILPDTDGFGAIDVAQSIRQAIGMLEIPHQDGLQNRISVSIGLATTLPAGADVGTEPSGLLAAADVLLYRAKHHGRDRVCAGMTPSATAHEC